MADINPNEPSFYIGRKQVTCAVWAEARKIAAQTGERVLDVAGRLLHG